MNLFKSIAAGILFALVIAVPRLHAAQFQSHEREVDALLARMTLDEKIGQMTQPDLNCVTNLGDIQKYGFGSMLNGGNSKPAAGNSPEIWRQTVDELQSWALKTRLKIPLIYGIDAVHGNNDVTGTVIFPHHIGMGATRNPRLGGKGRAHYRARSRRHRDALGVRAVRRGAAGRTLGPHLRRIQLGSAIGFRNGRGGHPGIARR